MNFMTRFAPQTHALLRIVAGLLFLEHGTVKLLHFPVGMPMPTGPEGTLMLVAGIIELVAGALITVGFFSRIAAFVGSGEMAFAYFLGHFAGGGFWPAVNHGGEAILFCFVFLWLSAAGPGPWAVNQK